MNDLSPYRAGPDKAIGLIPLAVGWLTAGQPFPTGAVSPEFLNELHAFCQPGYTILPPKGARWDGRCPLDKNCSRQLLTVQAGDELRQLDNAEIRVIGDDEIFAAPTLIYHYVTAHHYKPPEAFVTAVLRGPSAGSPEHRALIRALQNAP
jgi:hypothetical protein